MPFYWTRVLRRSYLGRDNLKVIHKEIKLAYLSVCSGSFYHMMSWKWKMDQSYVSIQVTCQVVVDWQRPAKSNYDLLLSSTSKFNWMHYLNDVKLLFVMRMTKYTWKYIQTVSNSLLWFHTMGLPTMVAHFILYWWHSSQGKQLQSWFCKYFTN